MHMRIGLFEQLVKLFEILGHILCRVFVRDRLDLDGCRKMFGCQIHIYFDRTNIDGW